MRRLVPDSPSLSIPVCVCRPTDQCPQRGDEEAEGIHCEDEEGAGGPPWQDGHTFGGEGGSPATTRGTEGIRGDRTTEVMSLIHHMIVM